MLYSGIICTSGLAVEDNANVNQLWYKNKLFFIINECLVLYTAYFGNPVFANVFDIFFVKILSI